MTSPAADPGSGLLISDSNDLDQPAERVHFDRDAEGAPTSFSPVVSRSWMRNRFAEMHVFDGAGAEESAGPSGQSREDASSSTGSAVLHPWLQPAAPLGPKTHQEASRRSCACDTERPFPEFPPERSVSNGVRYLLCKLTRGAKR